VTVAPDEGHVDGVGDGSVERADQLQVLDDSGVEHRVVAGDLRGDQGGRGVDAVAEGGEGQLDDVGVERPLLSHEAGLLVVDGRQIADLVVPHQRLRPAFHELLDLAEVGRCRLEPHLPAMS
jgi:hypothetical protein